MTTLVWVLVIAGAAGALGWLAAAARTREAFFVASRTAGPVLAGLAGTAAGISAFVFVGGPGLFAAVGAASLWIVLSAPVTTALQCWTVGEPAAALAQEQDVLTVPGLLEARFGGRAVRGLAAAAIVAGAVSMVAVQARAAAVLGPRLLHVPGWAAALAVTLATAAYTAAGGMRAGLPAEAAQGVLMGAVALAVTVAALAAAGGPVAAWRALASARPELVATWGTAGPGRCLGWFLLFGLGTCAQPHYVQKFLMLRDREALRWLPTAGTASLAAVLVVWIGLGLAGTALSATGRLHFAAPDGLVPALLGAVLPPWARLAVVVAIAAAIMSTATSLLNLAAAALVQDLPIAAGRPALGLGAARLATLGVAAGALGLALGWSRPLALLGVLGWGTFTAALLAPLALGLNWRGATRRGAVAALLAGPAVQLALEAVGGDVPGLARFEPGLAGAAVATLALVAFSKGGENR